MAFPLSEAGGSLDDFINRVRDAWWQRMRPDDGTPAPWVVDVFENMVIVSERDGDQRRYYRVMMTVTDEAVTFESRDQWQEVKLDYIDALPAGVQEAAGFDIRLPISEVRAGEGDLLDGVIVVEGQSFNGNHYTRSALESGVKVFEGALMFADHQSQSERRERPERSVRDIVGRVKEAYIGKTHDGKTALRGKFLISRAEESLRTKIEEGIIDGLSLSALGQGKRDKSGAFVVESFQAHPFTSVDLVTVASAGGTFDALTESQRATVARAVLESITPEQLKQARPDLARPDAEPVHEADAPPEVRQLQESQGDDMSKELQEVVEQRDKLLEENARWFREARTMKAQQMVREAMAKADGLPEAAVQRINQVLEAKVDLFATHGSEQTEEAFAQVVTEVVEAERQYVASLIPNGNVTGMTLNEAGEPVDEAALDEALDAEFNALMGK